MTETTEEALSHELRLVPARDIMARAIGRCIGDEQPPSWAIEAATRSCRALIAAGFTIEDLS